MTEITPEQRKQLEKLGAKAFTKSFFTGIHHALMAVVTNIVWFMADQVFLDGNQAAGIVGSIVIGIFVFRRMHMIVNQDILKFQEEAKKIIKN